MPLVVTHGDESDRSLSPRGIDPYDKPNTIYVERHEPSGYSTVFRSTDFFQSLENQEVILEEVRDFQLRDKYMFATKAVVSGRRSGTRTLLPSFPSQGLHPGTEQVSLRLAGRGSVRQELD